LEYVWKVCKIKDTDIQCVVKLELEKDSKYIIPSSDEHFFHGKNRCDKAIVFGIYKLDNLDKLDNLNNLNNLDNLDKYIEYSDDTIAVPIISNTYLEYKKSHIVQSDNFDLDISNECTHGIHVFESVQQAINFAFDDNYSVSNIPIQISNIISNIKPDDKLNKKNNDEINKLDKLIDDDIGEIKINTNINNGNKIIKNDENYENDKNDEINKLDKLIDDDIGEIKINTNTDTHTHTYNNIYNDYLLPSNNIKLGLRKRNIILNNDKK